MISTKEVRHNRIILGRDIMTIRNTNEFQGFNHTVRLNWRDIQSLLSQTRAIYGEATWRVEIKHRPLLERLFDYVPRLTFGGYQGGYYGELDDALECTYEQAIFLVDRDGKLMKDSFVQRAVTDYSIQEDEDTTPRLRKPESVWDVLRRVDRKSIGAVVLATFDLNRSGLKWETTVFHVQDIDELLRWYEERRKAVVPARNGMGGYRPHKAGRNWH